MKFALSLVFFLSLQCDAAFDVGVGTSSVTSGRPAPALALNWNSMDWGVLYRSVGVQTTVYAQNAWTLAAYKIVNSEKIGPIHSDLGAGLGGAYILRTYRFDPAVAIKTEKESVLGPHLCFKLEAGPFYLGFDTLLGLTSQVQQHILLNFQDVSHVTLGLSF